MANKKITDLMSGTPTRDSLLESAIDISGTMDSRKVTTGAIADLASANVAAPYNSATTYAIGQYCLYEGNIYRCIAITTGTFDATKWTQIVVTSEFRRVVELTTAQYEALSSAEQNNGTLYILTDGIPPSETVTGSDIIPFIDVSDSNKPKSTTAAAVANLGWSVTDTVLTDDASIGTYIQSTTSKQIIKCNKFNLINLDATMKPRSASSGWATCWTLPSGISTPSADIIVVTVSMNNNMQRVRVTTNGEVQINLNFMADNNERICIQIMYIV